MKKLLLFFLVLYSCSCCRAQNYQCLQAGVKHYFINGNGYLRGIRIDSVSTIGTATVYYPFHTPRGSYDGTPFTFPVLDSNGGSWLGKKVLQLSDGTFILDSYWNDSVVIKTQANAGDSWVFYRDTSSLYYRATVISFDTMTILSVPDSVKIIMITANNSSGIVASDPLDSLRIILSKNHGFVQVVDLYTFPYHKVDSTYRTGLDFFLDRSTLLPYDINGFAGSAPSVVATVFSLIDFINPDDEQLYNWNVGDVFETRHQHGTYPLIYNEYVLDTVIGKVVLSHSVVYTLSGLFGSLSPYPPYTYSLSIYGGGAAFFDSLFTIIDTSSMPEEHYYGNYIFYYPYDSSYCFLGPSYVQIPMNYYSGGLGSVVESTAYKLGIGKTNYYYEDGEPSINFIDVVYSEVNGIICGSVSPVDTAKPIDSSSFVKFIVPYYLAYTIYPNPAIEEFTIKTNSTLPYTITLLNVMGQTIKTLQSNKQAETINVNAVPVGVYNVSITDENGNRVNKKLVIAH